ncbi:phosphatidylglycerophosphatase A family protein [Thiopseudomonas acetoxidans]|uniref:Phosphatidylglycerophosphatase A n=1 Tax=Thiopseudomonas acetoxidans TaxID=3041622 RepID=A0ABT7SS85_9GAMM|nr:phosphatidylglycerophosphatase A [Thiopseudomonas sp. CY1220]MDM7858859.1 phosphatidylglycerophosphatase A [Thiopseudomonas sp. CY1220]
MSAPQSPQVWRNFWHFLAFGFGTGLARKAPGTWGTLAGLVFVPFLQWLALPVALAIIAVATLFGVWLCGKVADDLGVHDHGGIVWDEIVGIWLTLILLPAHWIWWLAGFVVFRLFDILKPWPISVLDRKVNGGLGIMLDDLLAAVFAAFVLLCAQWFLLG